MGQVAFAECCSGRAVSPDGQSVVRGGACDAGADLRRGLAAFRAAGPAALRAGGGAGEAPAAAACDLVEALLLGLHAHLPNAILAVEFSARPGPGELARLAVRLARGPVVGEIATRSRQPIELHLAPCVAFTLKRPASSDLCKAPVVLGVDGFEYHALPELVELRARLPDLLASTPDGWHPRSVGAWWLSNRDLEFPRETSKLRRLCDSFQEVASLPAYFQGMAFWGYLHTTSRSFDAFEFYESSSGVTVSAKVSLLNAQEEHLTEESTKLCHQMLRAHRSMAERFAASTVNMGALFEGRALGQDGANPAKIAKLFSAARHWGPGDDGWHALDDTWLCVDKKDFLGRITEEQGRILWHAPGQPRAGAAVQKPSALARAPAAARKAGKAQSGKSGASCRFTVLVMGVLLALPAVLPVAMGNLQDLALQ